MGERDEAKPIETMTRAEAISAADRVIDEMPDRDQGRRLRESETRGKRAGVAMQIADDRYSAGSTAARCTIAILLIHGLQAAEDFAADLDHHEG